MAALSTPGAHRPSDLEKIIALSTTGVASCRDPVLLKSVLCLVLRVRGRRFPILDKSALIVVGYANTSNQL
jgi:hypothetical protein